MPVAICWDYKVCMRPGLTDLKRAQTLFDKLELDHQALTVINSIATLYNRMGDYAQARDIYERALKAQRAAGMLREQGVTLHNLGRAHENLKEWDAARVAFQECHDISRGLKYARGEAYALRGLAAVMNGTGDPQGALATLDRAQALQKRDAGRTPQRTDPARARRRAASDRTACRTASRRCRRP